MQNGGPDWKTNSHAPLIPIPRLQNSSGGVVMVWKWPDGSKFVANASNEPAVAYDKPQLEVQYG